MTAKDRPVLHAMLACILGCLILLPPSAAYAQEDNATGQERLQSLLDRVPLPGAYRVRSFFYRDGEDDPSQQIDAWVAADWCAWIQAMAQPGLGFVPSEYFHGTLDESWHYYFDRHIAERSEQFSQWHRNGAEQLCSPLYLVRVLRLGGADVGEISIDPESATTSVTLSHPQVFIKGVITFDNEHGWLTRLQIFDRAGGVVGDTRFEDWRELDAGKSVPYQIYTDLPGAQTIKLVVLVTEAELLDPQEPPDRLEPGSEFTIVDQIEKVTKNAKGKVLGPIESGAAPAVRTTPPGSGLSARAFMLIGVGLILLAGIVLGIRRWRGA